MSEAPIHRQFFGDAERDFRLTPALITELERKTATGIGNLCRRIFQGDFKHHEVCETIRLALIGGGTAPEEAAAITTAYVQAQPLAESYGVAVSILTLAWFGKETTNEQ